MNRQHGCCAPYWTNKRPVRHHIEWATPTVILIVTIVIALLLVSACVLIHYEVLRLTSQFAPPLPIATRSKVLIVISGVFAAHLAEICLFAAAYAIMHEFPLFGTIDGEFNATGLDYFYFSITSYTTLGVGDLFPHGAFRLIAGMQALTGFVLIGWSASFTYLAMERFWGQHSHRRRHGDMPAGRDDQ